MATSPRISLNGITRGAFQSASVGYWVSQSSNGRGLASAAVAEVVGLAFRGLGLHRLQAETLLHNAPSQRVLIRNGFRPFAVAPSYLKIAGEWQDHVLFHLLASNAARVNQARVNSTNAGRLDGSRLERPAAMRSSLDSQSVFRVGQALSLVLDVDGNLGERLRVFPAVVGAEEQLT